MQAAEKVFIVTSRPEYQGKKENIAYPVQNVIIKYRLKKYRLAPTHVMI
jgi:hypothetical protein